MKKIHIPRYTFDHGAGDRDIFRLQEAPISSGTSFLYRIYFAQEARTQSHCVIEREIGSLVSLRQLIAVTSAENNNITPVEDSNNRPIDSA